MRLQAFIQQHMETILLDWEQAARSLPRNSRLTEHELHEHAKDILSSFMAKIAQASEQSEELEQDTDQLPPVSSDLLAALQQESADLIQLASEYKVLRACISRIWMENARSAEAHEHNQLIRFHAVVDEALVNALRMYSRQVTHSRRTLLKELKESEERYRALAELCPDAMLVHVDMRFVYANAAAAALLGASSPADILGLSPLDLTAPEFHESIQDRIGRVLDQGKATPRLEFRMRRLDGSEVDAEVAAGPVTWEGRAAVQVVMQDISERKRVEQELRLSDQRKDEFLATLAHELRNPLAPIRTGVNLLRLAKDKPGIAEDALAMMERQMSHLVRLVDDLLDISRISRGKVALRRESVDARDAIAKALEAMTAGSASMSRRHVQVDCPSSPLQVRADPVRLVQVISNLLSNAGKHTAEDGNIWIRAWRTGAKISISVRDDGLGMEPQTISRLFKMFMQVDSARMGGLGIGLALSRSLVELHGGSLEAYSEGLGKGSEFIVCLPTQHGGLQDEMAPAFNDGPALHGKRLLVVDDNMDAAASLGTLLSVLGAEVRAVNEGEAALDCFDEFRPDTVLLDLGMPRMDGFEVAQSIRNKPGGELVKIVAVTGWGQDEDRQKTRRMGFDYHLVKPIDVQDLQRILAEPLR